MSASSLPARRSNGRPRFFQASDRLRLQHWNSLQAAGKGPVAAWVETVTHPEIGTRDWRGKTAMPEAKARQSLASFLERAAPQAMAEAQAMARVECAAMTSRMIHVIRDVAEGNFGEGTVTTAGGVERVKIDAPGVNARVNAAKTLLQIGGVMPRAQDSSSGGGPAGPQVAVQFNNYSSAHDTAAELAQNPEALAAAMEANRALTNRGAPPRLHPVCTPLPEECMDPADVDKPPIRYTDPKRDPWDVPDLLRP